jgi:hypothetical protein
MIDFAEWGVAAEAALGLEQDAFMKAYNQNRADANALALDMGPIPAVLCRFMDQWAKANQEEEWSGAAKELHEGLEQEATESETKQSGWPKAPNKLTGRLKRLAPNLRAVDGGLDINFGQRTGKARPITIKIIKKKKEEDKDPPAKDENLSSQPSLPSSEPLLSTNPSDDRLPPVTIVSSPTESIVTSIHAQNDDSDDSDDSLPDSAGEELRI